LRRELWANTCILRFWCFKQGKQTISDRTFRIDTCISDTVLILLQHSIKEE
jgi:hypothetical protein